MDYKRLKDLVILAETLEEKIKIAQTPELALTMNVTDAVSSIHIVTVNDSADLRTAILGSLTEELTSVQAEIKTLV